MQPGNREQSPLESVGIYQLARVPTNTCGIGETTRPGERRLRQPDDFFLDGLLHQLRLVVDVQLAHQVELARLDRLHAQDKRRGDLLHQPSLRRIVRISCSRFVKPPNARSPRPLIRKHQPAQPARAEKCAAASHFPGS